jgi:hypothetical protein
MKILPHQVKFQAVVIVSLSLFSLLLTGCNSDPEGIQNFSRMTREEQARAFNNPNVSPRMRQMMETHGGKGSRGVGARRPAPGATAVAESSGKSTRQ